jgi:hypothetical protein
MTPAEEVYKFIYHMEAANEGTSLYQGEKRSLVVNGSAVENHAESNFPIAPPQDANGRAASETSQGAVHVGPPDSSHLGNRMHTVQSVEPSRHGSQVLEIASWTFPADAQGRATTRISEYIHSQLVNDNDVSFLQIRARSKTRRRRRLAQPQAIRKNGRAGSSNDNPYNYIPRKCYVRDISFDARYLQYDESPYGYVDQLVQRPGNIPLPSPVPVSDETLLQSIPDPPAAPTRSSRVGPGYQARVPRRKEDYSDKRNAAYLPKYVGWVWLTILMTDFNLVFAVVVCADTIRFGTQQLQPAPRQWGKTSTDISGEICRLRRGRRKWRFSTFPITMYRWRSIFLPPQWPGVGVPINLGQETK